MERKEIAKALGEHFGVEAKYKGVPSFAYEIATQKQIYTIDRAGKITTSAGSEVEFDSLINKREEAEKIESTALEIAVPMQGHTGITLRNLVNMIYSKQALIKKALGLAENIIEDDFCTFINVSKIETLEDFKAALEFIGEMRCPGIKFDFNNSIITFKYKEEATPEEMHAFTQLAMLLNHNSKVLKYVSAKAKDTDNDKFTFRVFLVRLGMVGDEFKITRKALVDGLSGCSAFRNPKEEAR